MVVLGVLVLVLARGLPDISGVLPGTSSADATSLPSSPAAATAPSFAPVADAPDQHEPLQSKVAPPKPVKANNVDAVWINHPDGEQKKELERLVSLIGVDNQEVIKTATPKAESGDANYQYLLAAAHTNESSQYSRDPRGQSYLEKALYWYKEASALGHPMAQFNVGQFYRLAPGNVIQRDIDEAIRWYSMAADNPLSAGDAENELGRIYEYGEYKPKDIQRALDYYKTGAERGNAYAQNNYASMLYNGTAGPRNIPEATKWLQRAAEQDSTMAQLNLALAYKRGRVTGQPDYNNFLDWAHKAAKGGYIPAMIELGNFYRSGESGEINNKQAAAWFRQAALKKNPEGQFLFAEMYEQGLGVPRDSIQAYLYYSLAKEGSYAMATGSLDALSKKMSPSELDHAQKMVRALKE